MTTSDTSQCPELISKYNFNGHCPRVKFVYYVNKYLLVVSFKLETAEIIKNSVTKMRSSMYRFTGLSTSTSVKCTRSNLSVLSIVKFGLATPLQYHARNKEANLILQSHGIGVHHIPGPLVVKCM